MTKWLLSALAALSISVHAEQNLLQQLCETTDFTQALTVSIDTPVVIANHRNGRMLSGQEAPAVDISRFGLLLLADNSVSEGCLAYLQRSKVLKVTAAEKTSPILARIHFKYDRSVLSDTSVRILNTIAQQLKNSPSLLTLEGYTDSMGSNEYNLALGLRRSETVKQYLAAKGINPETMQAVSQGASKPIADNTSIKGREQNRRVDLKSN